MEERLSTCAMSTTNQPVGRPPTTITVASSSNTTEDGSSDDGALETLWKKVNEVRPKSQSLASHTIFRVPEHIRRCDTQAYKPLIVSIGPYHHRLTHKSAMQEHKLRCVRHLLSRHGSPEHASQLLEHCLLQLKALDAKVRCCYLEDFPKLKAHEMAELMLLDGCFIIHLLLKCAKREEKRTNREREDEEEESGKVVLEISEERKKEGDMIAGNEKRKEEHGSGSGKRVRIAQSDRKGKEKVVELELEIGEDEEEELEPELEIGEDEEEELEPELEISKEEEEELEPELENGEEEEEELEPVLENGEEEEEELEPALEISKEKEEELELELKIGKEKEEELELELKIGEEERGEVVLEISEERKEEGEMITGNEKREKEQGSGLGSGKRVRRVLSDRKRKSKVRELELQMGEEEEKLEGPFVAGLFTHQVLLGDLLKLENQIPFFIIETLFDVLKTPGDQGIDLPECALQLFQDIHPPKSVSFQTSSMRPIHHLLHLFHSSRVNSQKSTQRDVPYPVAAPEWIPPATELAIAGVEFRKKEKAGSFLDITFNNGIMEIPPLRVYDYTGSLFRNLITFEQCYFDTMNSVTIYAVFMDCIIDEAGDARLLHLKGILINRISSDEAVVSLFNQLCNQINYAADGNHLQDLFVKVNKYYDSKFHNWRAGLMRDYLSKPWTIILTIAEICSSF